MLNQDIFRQKQNITNVIGNQVSTPKERVRQVRGDKIKDVKFPVTESQRKELRRRAGVAKNETDSNTEILLSAISEFQRHPHKYPPVPYKDTGTYMHAKPCMRDYRILEELFINVNEKSRRSFIYRLMMNHIGLGGGQQ